MAGGARNTPAFGKLETYAMRDAAHNKPCPQLCCIPHVVVLVRLTPSGIPHVVHARLIILLVLDLA